MRPLQVRLSAFVAAVLLGAIATLFGAPPASAAPGAPVRDPVKQCTTAEWRNPGNFQSCVDRLQNVSEDACYQAPTPSAPDSGMAGWFADRPAAYDQPGYKGLYTKYGYSGYDFETYGLGCADALPHPEADFENTVASGEFLLASSVVGASNALRERAWDPSYMWGWADPLVKNATRAVYDKVFTVFGAITLVVIGLYLLWRSRQADMSNAITTAGWAVMVMVVITAIAQWPTLSAGLADKSLITSLNVIHDAVGPPAQNAAPNTCVLNPDDCTDHRSPSLRASDTATEGLLYRNWLRGTLGSTDSDTAKKYGPVLYDAKSFTWGQIGDARKQPQLRQQEIEAKSTEWKKVAAQIKTEDPEAYEYLQGQRGMDRIGAGFIAILASLFYALFDITASILILLGFMIFRWAVIAAPILGTVGLMRPASSGLRRLANAVIAAIFNIIIFGTGSAIYLFAVSLILSTASLAGWLQVVLIWLTGVVGWLLLRPYRRITQLGGKDSTSTITSVGGWHRLFLRDVRQAATLRVIEAGGTNEPTIGRRGITGSSDVHQRPESRHEDQNGTASVTPSSTRPATTDRPESGRSERTGSRRTRQESSWESPDVYDDEQPSFTIYRPDSDRSSGKQPPVRRPESTSQPR